MTPSIARLTSVLLAAALLSMAAAAASAAQDFTRIDSLRDAGAYQEALAALEALRQEHPREAGVLWRMGQTYVDLGEAAAGDRQAELYAQAVDVAEAAVEADPQSSMTHTTLAVAAGRVALNSDTRRKVELSRTVKEHVDRALELDPENEMAYHVRGRWNYGVSDLNWIERAVVKTVYGGLPEASFEQATDRAAARETLDALYRKLYGLNAGQSDRILTHFQVTTRNVQRSSKQSRPTSLAV